MLGPPPPEVASQFKKIKYCVILMIFSTLMRLIAGGLLLGFLKVIMTSMNLLLNTVIGIFLLRDDRDIGRIHQLLINSCCSTCHEQCDGSLRCLMPFVICLVVTVLLDLLQGEVVFVCQLLADPKLWAASASAHNMLIIVWAISAPTAFVSQTLGAFFGWQAFKELRGADPGAALGGNLGGYAPPPFRPAGDAVGVRPSDGLAAVGSQALRGAPAQHTFKPFSGQGQRLGD